MMNKTIKEITDVIEAMRQQFGWQETDTPEFLVDCILDEAKELKQAFHLQNETEIAYELADVMMYAITLCHSLNLDLYSIIAKKAELVKQRTYE